jgi:hypothetical protein
MNDELLYRVMCALQTIAEQQIPLRDWFAGQAAVMLASPAYAGEWPDVARDAYLYADAMMAERAKVRTP